MIEDNWSLFSSECWSSILRFILNQRDWEFYFIVLENRGAIIKTEFIKLPKCHEIIPKVALYDKSYDGYETIKRPLDNKS